jgi:hypothetical protein
LESRETAPVGGLASLMRIDRTTLNRNMKPLVKVGLITLKPGQDSRTRQIQLTQAGKRLCGHTWGLWGEARGSREKSKERQWETGDKRKSSL